MIHRLVLSGLKNRIGLKSDQGLKDLHKAWRTTAQVHFKKLQEILTPCKEMMGGS